MQAAMKQVVESARAPRRAVPSVAGDGRLDEKLNGAAWSEAQVAEELADVTYRLSDGKAALQAASCLLRPRAGDRVLCVSGASGDVYILAILARPADRVGEIGVPQATELILAAPRVTMRATDTVRVESLRDVEITAVAGDVSLTARNLLTTVTDAIIQNMREYIGRAATWSLAVRSFLRMHSQQAFVIADEDIKVDAERISLG